MLMPKLATLKIPVSIYAITISILLAFAWRGYFSWNLSSRFFILFGAVAFVASDSFLAINKFYAPFEQASFLIMVTYLATKQKKSYLKTLSVLTQTISALFLC